MNKKTRTNVLIAFSTLIISLIIIIAVIFGALYLLQIFNLGITQVNESETFLLTSKSPDDEYTLHAYKTEPGATVDFSIKVYLENSDNRELIYNAYHEYQAEIIWVDNENVCINGKTLDLSVGEKYDWRA